MTDHRHDHIVMHDGLQKPTGTVVCTHCGTTDRIPMPISITLFTGALRAFEREHRDCPEPRREAA